LNFKNKKIKKNLLLYGIFVDNYLFFVIANMVDETGGLAE
jgi:hypothetical protein